MPGATPRSEDPLTGLRSRSWWAEALTTGAAGSAEVAVAVIDVDRLAALNYRHDHEAGDRALRAIAGVLRRQARAEEAIARVGGGVFAALWPAVTAEEAVARAESLRAAIAGLDAGAAGPPERVTASIGVAAGVGVAAAALYAAALAACAQAKALGRDRVCAAGDAGSGA